MEPITESWLEDVAAAAAAHSHGDLSPYPPASVRRALVARMEQTCTDQQQYLQLVRQSGGEAQQLWKELLVPISKFFRNPSSWQQVTDVLSDHVRSAMKRDEEKAREGEASTALCIWVAGCCTGEEAYTASIVCEAAERSATCSPIQCRTKGTVGDASPRFRVVATDIDRDSLDAAEEGIYPAVGNMFSFVEDDVPHEARAHVAKDDSDGRWRVVDAVKERISFEQHDLCSDTPPVQSAVLICCRNVLMYFKEEVQERLINSFQRLLRPHRGSLLLGERDVVAKDLVRRSGLYEAENGDEMLYHVV